MNSIEYKMSEYLSILKNECGVFEIKAELESEASRLEELMRLKDITSKLDLPIILKIGGPEAITDIYVALSIGTKGIVAPMTETPFAVSKFIGAVKKYIPEDNLRDIETAINVETITTVNNLDQILLIDGINQIKSMTVGRVDLAGSMSLNRDKIESEQITNIVLEALEKIKNKGLKAAVGGAISTDAIPNIERFIDNKLIDKFETRKVVFSSNIKKEKIRYGILNAVKFEYLWLQSKKRYYGNIKSEDNLRIEMIENRLLSQGEDIPNLS